MEKPIRVAHIIGKWLGGGVEAVVMNYYRHIDKSKIQFDFICDEDSTNIPYKEIEKLGGKVILIPPYQKIFKYHKELKKILKEGNYNIVHSHINTLSVFSLYAAKKAGVPVRIAHSHSTTNKKEWKKNLLKQILRPFSKVFATNYMACSELAGRWLFGNKTFDKGEVHILNNAIDLDKFIYNEELRNKHRKELGIKNDTLVIGHVGRFVEQKNHRFLIDVFNKVHEKNNNSILLLIGQGPLEEEMKEKVANLGLTDSVIFLGQRSDVNELYSAMDVFVLPSLYEGLPVVGVETQTSGLLCVLSDDMTKETKILDSTAFYSLNKSAKEWANKILKSSKEYKRCNTFDEVSNSGFNIKKQANLLEELYLNKSKQTVLFLANSNVYSGLENVTCQIIEYLLKKYNCVYITKSGPIIDILKKKNINYEIISKMSIKELKRIKKKFNPVIVHANDFTSSFIGSFSFGNIPVISHIHQNPPWIQKINYRSLIFLISSIRCKKIITVSKTIEDEFIFSKLIKNKIVCIGNPININIDTNLTSSDKEYDICCVGRVDKVKNPDLFIEIIDTLRTKNNKIKAVWVGDGEYKDDIVSKVKKLGLGNNVEFVGFKSNPNDYVKKSRIFLLCSNYEGFGLAACEALSLSIPCVVSNVGGLRYIVNDSCGKLCNNKEEYVNEIEMLLSDAKHYDKKSESALLRAQELNNYNQYMASIENIYNSFIR